MKHFLSHFRDPISALTHLIGAIIAVIGTVYMVNYSWENDSYLPLVASWMFGISMVLLYTSSAVYHWLKASPKVILWLKKIDHMMIFVLIAGSYTPFCLLALDGTFKWIVFYSIWGIALGGIILKLAWIHAPRWISTIIYLGMGWISLIIFPSLNDQFGFGGFFWLGLGGAFYSIGAVIYALKKPNPFPNVFGFHEIWHLFVMAGTFSHFWSVYHYVLPIA